MTGTLASPTARLTRTDVAEMVARRTSGYSRESPFYASKEIFDLDIELIFGRHWIFVAAEPEIPEEGDYVTVDLDTESVIIVRDDDMNVNAFRNVCRHRGARLLDGRCGAVGNIVCPYHQWTYGTDGALRFAESQADGFDKSRFGLRPVHVRTVAGLIFICLADEPPADFDEVAGIIESYVAPYGIANTKIAHQSSIIEDGNWKLTMENNRECYHCEANHPELLGAYFPFLRFDDADIPARQRPMYDRYVEAAAKLDQARVTNGVPAGMHRQLDSRPTGFFLDQLPLMGEGASYGTDGKQLVGKLLGSFTEPVFGDLHLHMQPNAWFHFLSDHVTVFSVLPIAPDKTMVRTTWLVREDAVEGVDYHLDDLTFVWKQTNAEDCALVERTQRGVSDPGYEPGPYAVVEDDVDAFVSWYISRLGTALRA